MFTIENVRRLRYGFLEVKANDKIANFIELQNSVNVRFADLAINRLLCKHRTIL